MPDEWLKRPSLAYHVAFDFCAAATACTGGPTIVLAGSLFYARELVRRLEDEVWLYFTRSMSLSDSEIQTQMGPEVDWGRVSLYQLPPARHRLGTLLCAEPERDTWLSTWQLVHRFAPVVACIHFLGTTPLRRVLPEWQRVDSRPAQEPFNSYHPVARALSAIDGVETDTCGFHGPLSLAWGLASRVPAALGRQDLVDRCFAAMRRSSVVQGWQARLSPVWLVTAKRVNR